MHRGAFEKRVLHLLGVFRPARHPEQHKADDEQYRDAAHAHIGTAGKLAAHTDDHGAQEGCPLPQMSNRPKYSPDFSAGMILAKWLRLSACTPPWNIPTITASTQNCHCWVREESKHRNAGIGRDAHRDQLAGGYFALSRPKISAEGKATIWVTSSASSRPVVSRPRAVP